MKNNEIYIVSEALNRVDLKGMSGRTKLKAIRVIAALDRARTAYGQIVSKAREKLRPEGYDPKAYAALTEEGRKDTANPVVKAHDDWEKAVLETVRPEWEETEVGDIPAFTEEEFVELLDKSDVLGSVTKSVLPEGGEVYFDGRLAGRIILEQLVK